MAMKVDRAIPEEGGYEGGHGGYGGVHEGGQGHHGGGWGGTKEVMVATTVDISVCGRQSLMDVMFIPFSINIPPEEKMQLK